MRKFIHKVQELGKKAAEFKQAVQSAPAQAAEIRQAVVLTASEFHQLRSEVQSNLGGLRANSEDTLLKAIRDINDNTYTFEKAGYELTELDLDLGLNQRLAVHLQRFEDVPHSTLRGLAAKEPCETVKAILSGILKAEETAANVELTHLHHDGIVVHIGAVPVIRMCWRAETLADQQTALPATVPPAATVPSPSLANSPSSFGSFFEQRPAATAAPTIVASPVNAPATAAIAEPATTTTTETVTTAPPASPWSRSALDRFKKMPDLSKHR